MDGMYGLQPALMSPFDYESPMINSASFPDHRVPASSPAGFGSGELISVASAMWEAASISDEMRREDEVSTAIMAKIASHPRYPRLLQAYIECQKVGTPSEVACLLDEITQEPVRDNAISSCLAAEPELDEFMETFSDTLVKYKSDLSRPFDEATRFLNKIESQLSSLCKGTFVKTASDDGILSSDEEHTGGEVDLQDLHPRINEERCLKDNLRSRFGSRIVSLKVEFSKKEKKGKLPREARLTLLQWWNAHYEWPYPTETDKLSLAATTGLDQMQINNWFINQRKRHWKPLREHPICSHG